jgi:hypothetical protein
VCKLIADSAKGPCTPTADEIERFRMAEWEDRWELIPADASTMRSVARLYLERRGPEARF